MKHFPSDPYRYGAANRDAEEEAIGWTVRLSSGEFDQDERTAFEEWHAVPENAHAYIRAQRLWQACGPILAKGERDAWPVPDATESAAEDQADFIPSRNLSRRRWLGNAALAASLTLVAVAAVNYWQVWRHDYVSEDTGTTIRILADGSRTILAPNTAIDADFEDNTRRINLVRGEAFFDVRHDTDRPFLVSTDQGAVRVLGTAFSVRRNDDDTTLVTVARGRVQVSHGHERAILTPDQQVSFGADGIKPLRAVNASLATGWTAGRLVLENRPLSEVLAEVNRYRRGGLFLLNDGAGRRRVDAVVDLTRVDEWINALSASQHLQRIRIGTVTILL